ncbi:MAG: helix-turn-helix domain-containing protein, partial [Myxococcota bacterium]
MADQPEATRQRVSARAVAIAVLPMLAAGGALLLQAQWGQTALAFIWGALLSGVAALASRPAEALRHQARLFSMTLARIAAGELRTIDAGLAAELGPFVHPLRQLLVRGHAVRGVVERLRGALAGLPEIVDRTNREVIESRSDIEETVEETASLLAHINGSIRGITAEVESLAASSEQASTSILQMGSATDEVARNAGALHDAAGASASAVHELSGSIRQVADGADAVQGMAEESAAAMVEMDRAIQEVTQHVSGASTLTQQVSTDAEAVGVDPVDDDSVHDSAGAGNGAVRQARLAVDEAPAGADPEPDPADAEPTADVQTLGELLQQARESRGLSVEETSARTRISLKMLGHLENDRFGEFAADAYAKGFLRNYGN